MDFYRIGVFTLLSVSLASADIITGADAGTPDGHVKAFDGATNAQTQSFFAYPSFIGGVRVAAGDVNNDGFDDIVTGAGPGGIGGHVKVFDGVTGAEIRSFFAFTPSFTGGVFVGSGDINGDDFADIIAAVDSTSSHVKVFDGTTNAEIRSFLAYGGFTGGVRVGSGDVNNDGFADIITGAGPGAPGGHVKVFDGVTGAEIRSFLSYGSSVDGVYVAGSAAAAAIPEPSSAFLLTAGCLGLALRRLLR